jgi:hypothetical protein
MIASHLQTTLRRVVRGFTDRFEIIFLPLSGTSSRTLAHCLHAHHSSEYAATDGEYRGDRVGRTERRSRADGRGSYLPVRRGLILFYIYVKNYYCNRPILPRAGTIAVATAYSPVHNISCDPRRQLRTRTILLRRALL